MRRRYSLRTLFFIVAVLCASLALTQFHFLVGVGVMIAFVVVVALFDRHSLRQLALIYGAVGGVGLFVLVSMFVAVARGETPSLRSADPHVTLEFTRQYAVPVGGFLGGFAGYLFVRLRNKDESRN